ncbi:hypothetical protein QVD17_09911 [Tagetes erecta]|uniref:Uncharacterized protein n=1 Tax=Tagetes erecta TaxID=13708 RepID=A0AAD8P5Q8_TARER|nr:hypothetical protein QVD17_09911 [Tagetes erecta]
MVYDTCICICNTIVLDGELSGRGGGKFVGGFSRLVDVKMLYKVVDALIDILGMTLCDISCDIYSNTTLLNELLNLSTENNTGWERKFESSI